MEASDGKDEADLWFMPGPLEEEPDFLPPGPKPEPREADLVAAWRAAEAGQAALMARVAARLGILDERLRRGPAGWRHRLALIEASELSWLTQDRLGLDRLSLYMALRISAATDDAQSLYRIGWAARRLTRGPQPFASVSDVERLEAFLDRRDRPGQGPSVCDMEAREAFESRAASWLAMMGHAMDLHPVTRACMGFHLWHVADLSSADDPLEAAVTASRVAVSDLFAAAGRPGTVFAPISMGGGGGFRTTGDPAARLARWLNAMESGVFTALRRLDEVEAWATEATETMAKLSGRTPPQLRAVFVEWPLVSVQMTETLTGAHRATVQRNIDWMEERGLVKEVTGQGRYRMWRIIERRPVTSPATSERYDAAPSIDQFVMDEQ
jgi:hypothetical protein